MSVGSISCVLNPLSNNKILDHTKFKASADDKINVTQKPKSEVCYGISRKHSGKKGENAGYQHFFLFPQCFQKPFCCRAMKSRDCLGKG